MQEELQTDGVRMGVSSLCGKDCLVREGGAHAASSCCWYNHGAMFKHLAHVQSYNNLKHPRVRVCNTEQDRLAEFRMLVCVGFGRHTCSRRHNRRSGKMGWQQEFAVQCSHLPSLAVRVAFKAAEKWKKWTEYCSQLKRWKWSCFPERIIYLL